MKIKVGQILKVKNPEPCGNYRDANGKFIKITEVGSFYSYDILDENLNIISGCCYCFKDEDLEPIKKTLDNLEVGDVIENDGYERKIVDVLPNSYVIGSNDDNEVVVGILSKKIIKELGYTVKQEEKVTELTLEQVADKFDIPVDELRIKE